MTELDIQKSLESVDPWLSAEVARRAARRALPVLLQSRLVELHVKHTIATWLNRPKEATARFLGRPNSSSSHAHRADAASRAADEVHRAASGDLGYIEDAAAAAQSAAGHCAAAYKHASRSERIAASRRAAFAVDASDAAAHNTAAEYDVRLIQKGASVQRLRALPLWPKGEPQWYLDAQVEAERVMEEQRKEAAATEEPQLSTPQALVLQIEAPEGASEAEIQALLKQAALEANRLHLEMGGGGLHVGHLQVLERATVEANQ